MKEKKAAGKGENQQLKKGEKNVNIELAKR